MRHRDDHSAQVGAGHDTPRRWTKLPDDGTSYAYWQSDDGCLIETKPRFRRMGYLLSIPASVSGMERTTHATYPTLREAKVAATESWDAHQVREAAQQRAWQQILDNTSAHHARQA